MSQLRSARNRAFASCLAFLLFASIRVMAGDVIDRFESGSTSWRLVEEDCGLRVIVHQRTTDDHRSGDLSETIQIAAGNGTHAYYLHEIPRARILRDFAPSVWVKASRPHIRLMALVEFPREAAPDGEGAVRRLIRGPAYTDTGSWQKLDFATHDVDFLMLYHRTVQALRLNSDRPEFDDRDAFVSAIVLDVYGGEGETDVWIDDLELEGFIGLDQPLAEREVGPVRQVAWQQGPPQGGGFAEPDSAWQTNGRTSVPRREESMLIVDQRPFFVKMVDYHGEPLELLRDMGFNTIRIDEAPTPSFNQEAARLGLWIVSPPPAGYRVLPDDRPFSRVLSWSVGTRLDQRSATQLEQLSRNLRTSPATNTRLQHADVRTTCAQLSRVLDLVEIPVTGELAWPSGESPYQVMADYRSRAATGAIAIAAIPLEATPVMVQQVAALGGRVPELETTPDACKEAVISSIAAGARGIALRTSTRLDSLDAMTQRRAALARWINRWIDRIEPWAAAGRIAGNISTNRTDWRAVAIDTERSRLILLLPNPQAAPAAGALPELALINADTFASARGYRVTEAGVVPLRQTRSPAGSSMLIPERDVAEVLIVTHDPLALRHVDRAEAPDEALDQLNLQHELVMTWIAKQSNVQGELDLVQAGSVDSNTLYRQALASAAQGERMMFERNYDAAYTSLVSARTSLSQSRRTLVNSAARPFAAPQSSPLCLDIATLPAHWDLAQRLRGVAWQGSMLAGGDFEDLNHLIQSGWTNDRWPHPDDTIEVELTNEDVRAGSLALRIRIAGPNRPLASGTDPSTLRIGSPAVRVPAGNVARTHGWIKIVPVDPLNPPRVWLEDSLGGPGLGQWLPTQANQWQEITFYRGALETGAMTLSLDIQGQGIVLLDDFQVHVARPIGRGE
ncbi:MAG: hypothetical protein KDA83_04880 [Planctomycetales bacterium]|nr:hypothetical protein [Planctomycetales bacterium]